MAIGMGGPSHVDKRGLPLIRGFRCMDCEIIIDGLAYGTLQPHHERRPWETEPMVVKSSGINSSTESDNRHGVHGVPGSHGIRGMIDGYLNDLARVGVNSNTVDDMGLISDYRGEVENPAHDDAELMSYSAGPTGTGKSTGWVMWLDCIPVCSGQDVDSIVGKRLMMLEDALVHRRMMSLHCFAEPVNT